MIKYLAALSLIVVMAMAIAIIDARSTDVIGAKHSGGERLATSGRIYASGIVEGATKDIHLRCEQAGSVQQVLVAAGDWVEAGDVLIRLDNQRGRHEVALAAAKLELAEAARERLSNGARPDEREEARALQRAAQARLRQAEQTWRRVQQLWSENAISQQEADDQRALMDALRSELEAADARLRLIEAPPRPDELRAAEARVAAAQAELDLARINLNKTELRSPRRARVLEVNVEPGELTGPNADRPLVVLSDTSVVHVRAFVEELDAPRFQSDMPAVISADGLRDTLFTGHVVSISPRMEVKSFPTGRPAELYDTKVREVLVEVPEAADLVVGLRVDVTFDAEQR